MLAEARKRMGLSQSQLAKLSGISVRMIQHYEQGVKDINMASAQTVYKLAEALGCDTSELLTIFSDAESLEALSDDVKKAIIKREAAERYSGFKAYPGTCKAIFNFIPDDMFHRLPAKELGEIAKVINTAYQAGKREKASD
ncbi:transcriptional regulator with XRE-family HTH domain [Anaerotaenia torta]|uniref:helix-turn-helix domain-containing protein n=1 Tax=Anaerotaenia torta TaxID=433293 RepID=UPI003D1EDE9E